MGGAATLAGVLGCGDNKVAANSRLGVGIIGVGGRGTHDWILRTALEHPLLQLIAVADVDTDHRNAFVGTHGGVASYVDYRELLARSDIDAVYVMTPHHWHALPAIHAARAGKHVYCEKPLSLTIAEGRAMVTAAREHGIAFQTGSQLRSAREFFLACEIVRNGRIGQVLDVDVVIGVCPTHPAVPADPLPAGLDWDRWLGPAPAVPYHQLRSHFTFRYFHDYGGGMVTDIGAHYFDIVQWALGRDAAGPTGVTGTASYAPDNFYEEPTNIDITFMYDAIPVRARSVGAWGITFRGTDGELYVTNGALGATPTGILDWVPGSGSVVLERSTHHQQNWLDAIVHGRPPICDVEIGHRSATVCHLGNLAIQTGRTLRWDAVAERFIDDPDADALLSRPSRPGYEL